MTPRQTALVLLSVWLLASGCSWLPSRGEHGARVELRPELLELRESESHAPPAPSGVAQPAYRGAESARPVAPEPVLDAGGMGVSPALSGQAAVQANFETVVPVAEMSAFIQELESASHIDAATRSQILATAFQTPPQLQAQMIRQYRALLALGRTGGSVAAPSAMQRPTTVPASVPLPQDVAVEARPEVVMAASHNEPVAPLDGKAKPDLERLLNALALEMKSTKAEAAAHTNSSDQPDDQPGSESEKSDDQVSTDATWEQLVNSAIKKLEAQKERRLDSDVREEDEARLRMLYLIANRRDDAVRAIGALEPEMQEFWSKQFFGLATLLNSDLIADRSNRLIESKRNFDEAIRRLGESSPLFVRNLVFITSVDSYGAYTPFDDYDFQPGEAVLLYAEVENFRCKETARGYHTALRSSYEIFDSSRQKVADHEFSTNEEYCKNARRDFFTVCEFRMPDKLEPGKYVLRLTVADLNGDKAGESSITFHIRDE
jgi:hypothetical protein